MYLGSADEKRTEGLTDDTVEMDWQDGADCVGTVSEKEVSEMTQRCVWSYWLTMRSSLLHAGHALQPQLRIGSLPLFQRSQLLLTKELATLGAS